MAKKDKNGKKEQKKVQQYCSVCYYKIVQGQNLQKMQCIGCSSVFHKFCYAPDFKQTKNNKFKCDLCKKRTAKGKNKEEKPECSLCEKTYGMLKEISNDQWMHVLCALTSPRVNVMDYQTLRFSIENSAKKNSKNKCSTCNIGFAQPCEIEGCKQKQHLNCLMYENWILRLQDQQTLHVNKLGLLDRNEGSLIYKLKKQSKKFSGLTLLQNQGNESRFYVCREHNGTNFIWCFCGKQVKEDDYYIQCDGCFRWYHKSCQSYYDIEGEGEDAPVYCKACKNNQIYIKNMSIPELISQVIKVQTKQVWDKTHVKYLDHFALKHSILIDKKMIEQANRLPIQRYFLRKELNNYDKQINDEIKQGRVLQILYYLFKKQIKTEPQITLQDIQLMLGDITSSSDKLNLKFSQEKPQKMWKSFLENKLKKLKKDDFREIKTKLNQLEKSLAITKKSERQIVSDLYPVLKLLSNSQIVLSAFKKMNEKGLSYQIMEVLVGMQLSKSQLQNILRSFKILVAARKNKFIDEDDYFSVTFKLYPGLSQPKIKDLKKIHQKLLKGVKQRKLYEKRRQILAKLEQKQEQKNYQEFKVQRNKGINQGLLFPINSKAFKYQVDSIEFEIRKKQILKKNNIVNFSELGQTVQNLRWLIVANSRLGVMQEQQRKSLQVIYQKYKLFNNLFNYMNQLRNKLALQNMQMGVLQQAYSSQNQNKEANDSNNPQRFLKQLYSILNDWPLTHQSINVGFYHLYHACIKHVSFTQEQQALMIAFFDKLVLEMDRQLNQTILLLKSQLVKYVVQVAKHLKIQEKWEHYAKMYSEYMQWKQKLDQDFIDIEKALESSQRNRDLITTIDQKLIATANMSKYLDLSSQIKKLKLIRTWSVFSLRMIVEKKATLTAIQAARTLMDKIFYPKNTIRAQIEKRDLQSKGLNKRIGRFLQKQKFSDMDFPDELKFLQAKMTIKQAEQLQKDLQNSQLDVEIQLSELKEELNHCRYFPTDIAQFCQQSKKLQTLAELRRKIIESPFLVCKLQEYQILLRAYYSKKCEEYSGTITKKQYFRMLAYGGFSSFEFAKKTQTLRKMYKEIQTAQRQIISIKPRPQLLLNYDLKKIKADLHEDPTESARVQKYFLLANKYRQKFYSYREQRADLEKYNALQAELNKLPLNLKDISFEIGRMKRDLQDCSNKVRIYFYDQSQIARLQFCSPFCSQLLHKYQRSGVKNQIMNKFQIIVTKARQIAEIYNNLSFKNYKTFSVLCTSSAQLQKNDQIYTKRMNAFQQMYQNYISNAEPLIEIGLTLLQEGGFLIKRPKVAQRILPLLLNVNNKFLKCEKRITPQAINNGEGEENEDSEDEDELNQDQEDYDDQNLESDSLGDDQDDIQNIDLDEEQDEQDLDGERGQEESKKEDQKGKGKKRARPNQYVISDSDQ